MTEVPNAGPVAGVMLGHGLFLAGCGVYGAAAAGWAARAMHSAYAGIGGCAALAVCAGMSVAGSKKVRRGGCATS